MSRANPIALRIASKTQSSMFIGVSQYYFYDHLKQNLNIFKLTGLVSKQIVLPTNKLLKYKINSNSLTVLTPHLLPINTACAAKHLFSTKYTLNKRRFSSAILHYVSWLHDDFNINYKRFNTGTGFVKYNKSYKLSNLSIAPINLNGSRQRNVKKNYTQFCHITKANQINDIYKYFVFYRSNNDMHYSPYKSEPSDNFINCLIRLSSLALKRGARLTKKAKIYMRTKGINLYDSKLLYMQNFKKMQIIMRNNLSLPVSYNAVRPSGLQKIDELFCFRPDYKDITNNMFLLVFLNLLYSQNNVIYNSLLAKQVSLTNLLSTKQQKSLLNTEKSTQFINLKNYIDSTIHSNFSTKYRYIISAYSGFKKSNDSNFSKVQKHINFFYNTAKPVVPLELVICRSFCEPAGLNYLTALENRLSKSRFNINFSSALFRRTSNNGFIPNYTNTQTGLIRLKAQIIFEFLYTLSNQGKSVIEQNNYSNHRHMLDLGNSKLWLRKGSSVRL
uniref:Uncharacterized protein n=1 Tax=Ulva sp. TM637 TaxID=2496872 RepID=A0A7R6SBN6_9CHLO|nr:hypothetical protein JXX86_mgp41 [Ulva sp. TM637]AZP40075.1 hypothetical protein [Ulva sp. TM637]